MHGATEQALNKAAAFESSREATEGPRCTCSIRRRPSIRPPRPLELEEAAAAAVVVVAAAAAALKRAAAQEEEVEEEKGGGLVDARLRCVRWWEAVGRLWRPSQAVEAGAGPWPAAAAEAAEYWPCGTGQSCGLRLWPTAPPRAVMAAQCARAGCLDAPTQTSRRSPPARARPWDARGPMQAGGRAVAGRDGRRVEVG